MNDRFVALREWFEKLGARERRLMTLLGIVFSVVLLVMIPLGTSLVVSSRRDANKALRASITQVKNSREEVQRRQAKREAIAQRYANRAPPLANLIGSAAKENKLDVADSQDKPEIPHGKRYNERTTVVHLRKSGMLAIAKTLEYLEQQHMPTSISRLNIRRRGGERDSYDIELGVSAFDREAGKETGAAGAGASGGSGGIK